MRLFVTVNGYFMTCEMPPAVRIRWVRIRVAVVAIVATVCGIENITGEV